MKKSVFLLSVFLLLLSAGITAANVRITGALNELSVNELNEKKLNMVWVIIDQISLTELEEAATPNLDYLQQKGAFSVINVRTVGQIEPESTYLSINAGNRCQGSKMSQNGKVYGNGALNDQINDLLILNQNTDYNAEPGLLGEIAKEKGLKIAVLGNSDIKGNKIRNIVSLAMDANGFVPLARIDSSILEESSLPWGYESSYRAYAESFNELKDQANAIFIETGDISRIEYYYNFIEEEREIVGQLKENYLLSEIRHREAKISALERIDEFMGFLIDNLDLTETQLGIISPTPALEEIKNGSRLGWLLLSGQDIDHGWLASTSIRRSGIITIADLLSFFNGANKIEANTFSQVYSVKVRGGISWSSLIDLQEQLILIYNLRSPFIKIFIFFQIVVILMSIIRMLLRKSKLTGIFSSFFTYLLLSLLLVPINALLIALFKSNSVFYLFFFFFLLLILELVFINRFIGRKNLHLLIITGVLIIIIFIDLWNNYQMLADSLLGYSSIIGARYYGLGNEYMGFYLGAFLINITILLEIMNEKKKINPIFLLPFFLLIIYSIGNVSLGANFGGMITAVLASAVTFYQIVRIYGSTFLKKWPFIISGIFFILLLILIDYWGIMGSRSHIGMAVEKVFNGDWQWIKGTIFRKFQMNLKLLRWTIWTRVLLAMIAYLIILMKKPVPVLMDFFAQYPYIKAGLYGALAGSLVTMVVNDSGVVAAATLLFYPVMSLLYFLKP